MPALYKNCSEIQKAEINKLQGFIEVYKAGCDLIHILELMEDVEKYKQDIANLKVFLKPYKAIYSMVGDDAKAYVEEEMGLNFAETGNSEQWGTQLLKYIANPSFLIIRKELVVACRQHPKFNELYLNITGQLKTDYQIDFATDDHKQFKLFTDNHIKCVQVFSQFDLLSRDLVQICQAEKEQGLMAKVAHVMQRICSAAAFYSNALQKIDGEENKTSNAYVAAQMIHVTDQQLAVVTQQLTPLLYQFKEKDEPTFTRFLLVRQGILITKKMNNTSEPKVLDELAQEWKALFPESEIEGTTYPEKIDEVCLWQQEIVNLEKEYLLLVAKINCATLKQRDTIEETIIKFHVRSAGALFKLNVAHQLCHDITGYMQETPATTKADYQSELTLEKLPKIKKTSKPSFTQRLRSFTGSTPKLTRADSKSSDSSPLSPRKQSGSGDDLTSTASSSSSSTPGNSPANSNKLPKPGFFSSPSLDPSEETFQQKKDRIAALSLYSQNPHQ